MSLDKPASLMKLENIRNLMKDNKICTFDEIKQELKSEYVYVKFWDRWKF